MLFGNQSLLLLLPTATTWWQTSTVLTCTTVTLLSSTKLWRQAPRLLPREQGVGWQWLSQRRRSWCLLLLSVTPYWCVHNVPGLGFVISEVQSLFCFGSEGNKKIIILILRPVLPVRRCAQVSITLAPHCQVTRAAQSQRKRSMVTETWSWSQTW